MIRECFSKARHCSLRGSREPRARGVADFGYTRKSGGGAPAPVHIRESSKHSHGGPGGTSMRVSVRVRRVLGPCPFRGIGESVLVMHIRFVQDSDTFA